MNDQSHEFDPDRDVLMERLRRARPVELDELPSGTDPAPQALMKEIMMTDAATARTTTDPRPTPGPIDADSIVRWGSSRRRRLTSVAAVALLATGAIGASIALQSGPSSTSRVHAAADATTNLGSGVASLDLVVSDPALGDFESEGNIRFDGPDSSTEISLFGVDGPVTRTVVVDGRVFSTVLSDQWREITDIAGTRGDIRLDQVIADLEELDGYASTGSETADGESFDTFTVSADGDELDGSSLEAFAFIPVDGDTPFTPPTVDYEVWVDDDGLIARLSSSFDDAGTEATVVAIFSDLGTPQSIEAPDQVIEEDPRALQLFEMMGSAPESVLDECFGDASTEFDLSDPAFDAASSCLRANGLTELADLWDELGVDGVTAAIESVDAMVGLEP